MNVVEQDEIRRLPDKYVPMGAWAYFGYSILFSLGLIGFIFEIVFALNNDNIARRNFARGMLIGTVIATVLAVILLIVFGGVIIAFLSQLPAN